MSPNFLPILEQWPDLLAGAALSLQLAVLAFAFGAVIGLVCACALHYGPRWLRHIVTGYVTIATNTPQLVQIFFLFFALPEAGIMLSPFWAVLIGLTFNAGAYLSQILRAGFNSVRLTEVEAAKVLGFSGSQIVRYVIVPHVLKVMFPALSNQFIGMTLGTSMAAIFGVQELTGRIYDLSSQTYLLVEAFSIAAVLYIAITLIATGVLAMSGRHLFRARMESP